MDPVSAIVALILGGMYAANRLAAGSAKPKDGGAKPAGKSNEALRERMGGSSGGEPGRDAGDEAYQLPVEHLPVVTAVPASLPAAAIPIPIRDPSTGKFQKRAA